MATGRDHDWGHVSGPYRALDHRFELRATDPERGELVAASLSPLVAPGAAGSVCARYELIDHGRQADRRFELRVDGERIVADDSGPYVEAMLRATVDEGARRSAPDATILHGAVLSRGDDAIAIVGSSGAGKSTLTAALLLDGWAYLSDELVVVDLGSLRARAYPRSLGLSARSYDAVPGLPEPVERRAQGDLLVPPDRFGGPPAPAEASLRALVLLDRRPHSELALVPMAPAEVLVEAVSHCFGVHDGSGERFLRLGELVGAVPGVRLSYAEARHAVSLLRQSLP